MKRVFILALAAFVVSCTLEAPERIPSTKKPAVEAPGGEGDAVAPRETMTRLSEDDLSPARLQMLGQAKKAKKELGQRLMSTLKSAVAEGDFDRGVEVCKTAAPSLTQSVEQDLRVEIGRTSFALRNPQNAPRPWAEPWVEQRVEEDVLLAGDEGGLRYLSPIRLAEPCVKCHGSAEQIPPEVKTMLAEKYPKDEATGFQPNDLRGYFWVEVAGAE